MKRILVILAGVLLMGLMMQSCDNENDKLKENLKIEMLPKLIDPQSYSFYSLNFTDTLTVSDSVYSEIFSYMSDISQMELDSISNESKIRNQKIQVQLDKNKYGESVAKYSRKVLESYKELSSLNNSRLKYYRHKISKLEKSPEISDTLKISSYKCLYKFKSKGKLGNEILGTYIVSVDPNLNIIDILKQ